MMNEQQLKEMQQNASRRVTIGGAVDRRGSLGLSMDDFFAAGRRPSLGLDMGVDALFGRRDSMDSTTAALDAAILDLTRRRYSMAAAGGLNEPPPPAFANPAAAALNVSTLAARQQQLQQQQRELEQRQKELEIQRQQLIANMQERNYMMQRQQQAPSLMMTTASPPLVDHSQRGHSMDVSHRSMDQSHRSSNASTSSQWWICQVCNAKAFASHEEAMHHEDLCRQQHQQPDPLNPLAMHDMPQQRNYSLGMDSSTHSHYDHSANLSSGPFANIEKPMPLAMPSDKDWLTPLHCFVRRHCVEIFTASEHEVQTPSKGKRKPITVGQVGIRCPHCHHLPLDSSQSGSQSKGRERGSVYYPTTIASIYNATMNLLQRHLHSCSAVPDDVMRRYETLKADDARSGTSKRYWIESALSLGLVDTAMGIRFSALPPPPLPSLTASQETEGHQAVRRNSNDFFSSNSNAVTDRKTATPGGDHKPAAKVPASDSIPKSEADMAQSAPLVTPEDKPYSTAFSYHLLSQMQPCVFTEADRLGKRKGLPPGFPGLACRHCFGGYGSGRFFPSSIKTLSDTSKTLNVLHNHMMRCRKCPAEVRESLESLRGTHDEERAKMKFGSQKAFFARIWDRLHGKDAPAVAHKRKAPPKQQAMSPQMAYMARMQQVPMMMQPPQTMGIDALVQASDPKRQKMQHLR